jgi:hypothetical protein
MKKFIGGYYQENPNPERYGVLFDEILVLGLEKALQHPAIKNVKEDYEDRNEIEFDTLTEKEQMKAIEDYIIDDEIFGGRFYEESEVEKTVKGFEEEKARFEEDNQ